MITKKFQVTYWTLRVLTLLIGTFLFLGALATILMMPFYESEGDAIRLQEKKNYSIASLLLLGVILVPNSLTMKQPYFAMRIAILIVMAVIDFAMWFYAYRQGFIANGRPPILYLGILVCGLSILTLRMKQRWNEVPFKWNRDTEHPFHLSLLRRPGELIVQPLTASHRKEE